MVGGGNGCQWTRNKMPRRSSEERTCSCVFANFVYPGKLDAWCATNKFSMATEAWSRSPTTLQRKSIYGSLQTLKTISVCQVDTDRWTMLQTTQQKILAHKIRQWQSYKEKACWTLANARCQEEKAANSDSVFFQGTVEVGWFTLYCWHYNQWHQSVDTRYFQD
jgi:hypothetical protein